MIETKEEIKTAEMNEKEREGFMKMARESWKVLNGRKN